MSEAIERVKHAGAVAELKRRLSCLQFDLTNRNWSNTMSGHRYVRMGEAIDQAAVILSEMRETLEALQEMEEGHK